MSFKAFFEGIQSVTEAILLSPLDGIRNLELSNWFIANGLSWVFLLIGLVAFVYWMKELKNYDEAGTEDKSSTSHAYLG